MGNRCRIKCLLGGLAVGVALAGAEPALYAATSPVQGYATPAPLASCSLLLDGSRLNQRLVVVGERGHILVSDDGGGTWQQARVPTQALLTAVTFHDEQLGWAVGHDAVILRTADGGATWELLYSDPEEQRPLLDVWFRDAEHGFAVGAYGYFLETSDGGDTWRSRQISDDDWHFNNLSQVGSNRLLLAAEVGNLYASDDGGASWFNLPSPYVGSFFRILPLGGETALLLGLRGHLFRTEDAGESWQEIETGTLASLMDAARLRDGQIVIGGLAGVVLWSCDGGRHFNQQQLADRQDVAALVETADGRVLAFGGGGAKCLTPP